MNDGIEAPAKRVKNRGGRTPPAEIARRAERLLEVATDNFVRLGYSATTVDRIAVEAGVAKRTIYGRYPDKRFLFFAVVERLSERRVFDTLPIADEVPVEEGLRRLARIMIEQSVRPEELTITRMILAELNHFPDLGKTLWRAVEHEHGEKLVAYFRHQKQIGAIRNLRPSFLADLFMDNVFSFINKVAILGQAIPSSLDIDEYISDLVDLLFNGIRP
jgi:TetR/AcrR family transcriptional repressor of mexJK operon